MCDGERKIWTWQGRLSVNRIAWEKVPQWERGAEGRRYRSTQSQKQVFRTETHVKSYVNTWYSVNTLGNVPQLHLCPITFFFLYIYVHIIYIYIYTYIYCILSLFTRACVVSHSITVWSMCVLCSSTPSVFSTSRRPAVSSGALINPLPPHPPHPPNQEHGFAHFSGTCWSLSYYIATFPHFKVVRRVRCHRCTPCHTARRISYNASLAHKHLQKSSIVNRHTGPFNSMETRDRKQFSMTSSRTVSV